MASGGVASVDQSPSRTAGIDQVCPRVKDMNREQLLRELADLQREVGRRSYQVGQILDPIEIGHRAHYSAVIARLDALGASVD